jgi:ATP-binding cassette subfamily B protein
MYTLIPMNRTVFSFIWSFMREQKGRFFLIFLLSFIWTIDATVWPYLFGEITDTLTRYDADRTAVWPALKWLLVYGVFLWVLVEVGFRSRGFIQAKAFPKIEADIRMAMFDHVQRHSPKYFNEHFAGSLANKISDMTTQSTQLLKNVLLLFFPVLGGCIVSLLFFAKVNPLFAWILGGWMVLHFGTWFLFTPKCIQTSNIHGEVRSSLAGKIVDSLTNNFNVNLFARFRFEKKQIAIHQAVEQQKNYVAQRYVQIVFALLSTNFLIVILALNTFLLIYWSRGNISTGEVVQIFNSVWNLGLMMWFAGEEIPAFFQSLGIAKQALSLMQDPQDILDSPQAKPLLVHGGEIVFDNVSFQHGEKELFSHKSVHIKPGEKVGLVGYSGAGKSTFVNLILRFFPVGEGRILIDGQDIAAVTLESLRKQVALIPQDPLLFHRTLEENIRYGRIEATREEVIAAAKMAHADEFIQKLPKGYDSLVGERGTKLSGGERQRIAIARALLAAAPILILDEATSSLDSVTEKYIQESLKKLMHNRTSILIAHRLSTLDQMDRLLVFHQGKIIEEGSHHELLAKKGHYAHLWQMQAGGFLPS